MMRALMRLHYQAMLVLMSDRDEGRQEIPTPGQHANSTQ
jgi:hypothetical protein